MYTTEDGVTKIDIIYEEETVWATQAQMAELFQKSKSTINEHIGNIIDEGELEEESVIRKFRTTASDGKNYNTFYYSLDMVISVGYRVKSQRGIQFRIWANKIIKEYLTKGFAMNDSLLKEAGGGGYFKELLERIRDIRSSEKVFYRQVLDLFATSEDYNSKSVEAQELFSVIQNKMHWATHGHTASELISERANSENPFMGLQNFKGARPTKAEAIVAKNYLKETELSILNRLVSAYLDLAEIHALRKERMNMKDWILEIDAFISMSRNEVLQNAGKVSQIEARAKAENEYIKYKSKPFEELTAVEKDFIASVKSVQKKLEQSDI